MTDTIFALATPMGRSGVAVIRVSGPQARQSLAALCPDLKNPVPRRAYLAAIMDPVSRETIDRGVVLFFSGPASYTGEDTAEYTIHGGPAVIRHMLAALSREPGHRMAEPGEFTRRAFESGKLDLTEAEAVADLIHAETEAQKAQALSQLGGALKELYQGWTEDLKRLLAHMEADIEFPDEDLPEDLGEKFAPDIEALIAAIAAHLDDNRRGERLRDGINVAVIGAPNAGKSSLVNALAQREIAIVSPIPGTTRDVLEAHLDLGGYPVILADTAGLRPDQIGTEGQESIESEGIRRALSRAREADLKILLFDGTQAEPDPHTAALIDDKSLILINKLDHPSFCHPGRGEGAEAMAISTKTGAGLEKLLAALKSRIEALTGSRETPSLTRQRHRLAVEAALEALTRAGKAPLPELMAEDLRLAIRALGRITGRVDVEDLLDVIFRDFCIGK